MRGDVYCKILRIGSFFVCWTIGLPVVQAAFTHPSDHDPRARSALIEFFGDEDNRTAIGEAEAYAETAVLGLSRSRLEEGVIGLWKRRLATLERRRLAGGSNAELDRIGQEIEMYKKALALTHDFVETNKDNLTTDLANGEEPFRGPHVLVYLRTLDSIDRSLGASVAGESLFTRVPLVSFLHQGLTFYAALTRALTEFAPLTKQDGPAEVERMTKIYRERLSARTSTEKACHVLFHVVFE